MYKFPYPPHPCQRLLFLLFLFVRLNSYYLLIYFGLRWVSIPACGPSLAAASGSYSICGARASPGSGLSRCRAWALDAGASAAVAPGLWGTGSIVVVHGLSWCMACGILLAQGSNLCLLHWQVDSLPQSPQGSPICVVLDNSHPDRCELVSYWGFNLHSLMVNDSIFSYSCCHLQILFGTLSIQVFCPFFKSSCLGFFPMLNCMSCLYMLDINPLLLISFANIFCHSVGFLFCLWFSLLCKSF